MAISLKNDYNDLLITSHIYVYIIAAKEHMIKEYILMYSLKFEQYEQSNRKLSCF